MPRTYVGYPLRGSLYRGDSHLRLSNAKYVYVQGRTLSYGYGPLVAAYPF